MKLAKGKIPGKTRRTKTFGMLQKCIGTFYFFKLLPITEFKFISYFGLKGIALKFFFYTLVIYIVT